MRLDRVPNKKTAAIIGRIFDGMTKESKYTLIPNGNFLHDGTNDPCVASGKFGVYYFTVKELPGFDFAIWMLNLEKFASERYYWTYCVFGAHEHDWDKFKPSYVQCKTSNRLMLDGELNIMFEESVTFGADELFDYIKKEPYLARYRELTNTNCNLEYISRRTAKRCIRKLDRAREKKAKIEIKQANRLIKKCSKKLSEAFEKIYLLESPNATPRYEFIVSKRQDEDFNQNGYYGYFDFTEKDQRAMSDYEVSYNIHYLIPEEFMPFIKKMGKNKSYILTQIK